MSTFKFGMHIYFNQVKFLFGIDGFHCELQLIIKMMKRKRYCYKTSYTEFVISIIQGKINE